MIAKLLRSGLNAGLGAVASLASARAAAALWRVATGEEPPARA